jgi:hypothetical protein
VSLFLHPSPASGGRVYFQTVRQRKEKKILRWKVHKYKSTQNTSLKSTHIKILKWV